jgi:AGCS family alanine or glycine:cation symporter
MKISQFKVFSNTLATTMGTGNIVGVASALAIGGPGSIFWMWVSAIIGMFIVYAENVLGSKFRYKDESGDYIGGALAYIKKGVKSPVLFAVYAVLCVCSSFCMGNMVQANSISNVCKIDPQITGIVLFLLVGIIIIGGIKRISNLNVFLMPALTLFYVISCMVVVVNNWEKIGEVFINIFQNAFGISEIGGASVGTAINIGIRRGIFSNEAGLGTSGIMHSQADNGNPTVQGRWGMFEVAVDTLFCCTLTAVTLLCSDGQYPAGTDICIVLYAFATIIGWSYCGETAFRALFGIKHVYVYRYIYVAMAYFGAVLNLELVWNIADVFNVCMLFPNLIAVVYLIRVVCPPFTKNNCKKEVVKDKTLD